MGIAGGNDSFCNSAVGTYGVPELCIFAEIKAWGVDCGA